MSEPVQTQYFVKELISNRVRLPSGRPIPWTFVGDDTGVLATNDPSLITELTQASYRQIGGIRLVTEAEFEDAKKKSTAEELRKLSLYKANNHFQAPRLAEDGVPAVEVKPLPKPTVSPSGQPIATPSTLPIPTPKSKRRSSLLLGTPTDPPAPSTSP